MTLLLGPADAIAQSRRIDAIARTFVARALGCRHRLGRAAELVVAARKLEIIGAARRSAIRTRGRPTAAPAHLGLGRRLVRQQRVPCP